MPDEMIRRWNTEIDTYLVYAGLFSAILTAFNVQSYQLLQPAVPDPTVLALQQISLQLRSYSVSPNFVNSTHSALLQTAPDDAATPVPRTAIWLNALWFSSLILSLSAASVGIMVKQWLNEYSSGLSGVSREAARLRQYRLNTLVKWHVAEIVIVIPILLQLALALFLAGLLVLLWTLHPAVAITASVLVGALAVFTLGTALLPLFNHSCAYLTPQTHLLYSFLQRVVHVVSAVLWRLLGVPAFQYVSFRRRSDSLIYRFLQWIAWNFVEREAVTWRGREQSAVKWSGHELDVDMLITAHGTTLHPDARAAATDTGLPRAYLWGVVHGTFYGRPYRHATIHSSGPLHAGRGRGHGGESRVRGYTSASPELALRQQSSHWSWPSELAAIFDLIAHTLPGGG
ncbi:hypothetical protein BV20DRAFT_373446 [Pilatotrama ljubarskyi]|nr:hypothetical protein BV20DRAFT_373446 [Pilatotrama ljubarskyi]